MAEDGSEGVRQLGAVKRLLPERRAFPFPPCSKEMSPEAVPVERTIQGSAGGCAGTLPPAISLPGTIIS